MSIPSAMLIEAHLEEVLCQLLRIDPAEWHALKSLYESKTAWSTRHIPKRKGVRVIREPQDPLLRVSRAALDHVLGKIPVHVAVHGAHRGTSVVTNARVHAGFGNSFYQLDLKDAFPSTDRDRLKANLGPKIQHILQESVDLEQDQYTALTKLLVELSLVDDTLPQGFPTSPAVLNVVLRPVDRSISLLLQEESRKTGVQYRYTRFVDDLTISSNSEGIRPELRVRIRNTVRHEGWTLAKSKISYFGEAENGDEERSTKMPEITGIIPHKNGQLKIARPRLKRFRSVLHEILKLADERMAQNKEALQVAKLHMDEILGYLRRHFIDDSKYEGMPLDEFFSSTWPLTTQERDRIFGIVGFVGMVYDQDLPSVIREPYLECKQRFHIGNKHLRGTRGYRIALSI